MEQINKALDGQRVQVDKVCIRTGKLSERIYGKLVCLAIGGVYVDVKDIGTVYIGRDGRFYSEYKNLQPSA